MIQQRYTDCLHKTDLQADKEAKYPAEKHCRNYGEKNIVGWLDLHADSALDRASLSHYHSLVSRAKTIGRLGWRWNTIALSTCTYVNISNFSL